MRQLRALVILTLSAGFLLGLGLTPQSTLAATTITVGQGNYQCTRDGLADAILAAGPDGIVTFDCDPAVIEFTTDHGAIPIIQNVTIDGSNNGTPITLDGNNQVGDAMPLASFFYVGAGKLTLQHITLKDGKSVQGALLVYNNGVTAGAADIIDVTFDSNEADYGGAISNFFGQLTITQSTFTSNKATDNGGGAIYNGGQLTITQSTFTSNEATSDDTYEPTGSGGAIYNGDSLTITQSTFISNEAADNGGAIYNGDSLTITQSTFVDNAAYSGGAINNYGRLTVSRSSFVNNDGINTGGAISTFEGSVTVLASTLTGNLGLYGSAIYAHDDSDKTQIINSTIIRPTHTTPSLSIYQDDSTLQEVILEGVILGGDGEHCLFLQPNGPDTLTDAYTLSNDTSCNLTGQGSHQNLTDLGLGPLTTATINGITQTYYPLLENSPAVDAGSASCDTSVLDGPDPDQIGNPRPYHYYCDIGAIESSFATTLLCANQWNGAIRMTDAPQCSRSETFINIAYEAPLELCVNNWNAATRLSQDCTRSEHPITITGDHTIPACVNNWTSALRLTTRCTRSETQHWL